MPQGECNVVTFTSNLYNCTVTITKYLLSIPVLVTKQNTVCVVTMVRLTKTYDLWSKTANYLECRLQPEHSTRANSAKAEMSTKSDLWFESESLGKCFLAFQFSPSFVKIGRWLHETKKSPKIHYSAMVREIEKWSRIYIQIRISTKI